MRKKLITPPTTLAVTVTEFKAHSRIDFTDEDTLVEIYLRAAISTAEQYTGRAFIDQTWDYFADTFPTSGGPIVLPHAPLIAVTGVYYQTGDSELEFSASDYLTDETRDRSRVALAYGKTWPTIQDRINAVRVRYRAGYLSPSSPDEPDVPFDIKAAIMLIAGHLYQNRETVVVGQTVATLPMGAIELLRNHRVHTAMA